MLPLPLSPPFFCRCCRCLFFARVFSFFRSFFLSTGKFRMIQNEKRKRKKKKEVRWGIPRRRRRRRDGGERGRWKESPLGRLKQRHFKMQPLGIANWWDWGKNGATVPYILYIYIYIHICPYPPFLTSHSECQKSAWYSIAALSTSVSFNAHVNYTASPPFY